MRPLSAPLLPPALPGQPLLGMQGIKAAFEEATKLASNPLKAALVVLIKGQIGKDRLTPDAKKVTIGQDLDFMCAGQLTCRYLSALWFVHIERWELLSGNAADMLHISNSSGLGQPQLPWSKGLGSAYCASEARLPSHSAVPVANHACIGSQDMADVALGLLCCIPGQPCRHMLLATDHPLRTKLLGCLVGPFAKLAIHRHELPTACRQPASAFCSTGWPGCLQHQAPCTISFAVMVDLAAFNIPFHLQSALQ